MSRKFNLIFQGLLTAILGSSVVVACGKQDARKRIAPSGQTSTGNIGDGKNAKSGTGSGSASAGGSNSGSAGSGGGSKSGGGSTSSGGSSVDPDKNTGEEHHKDKEENTKEELTALGKIDDIVNLLLKEDETANKNIKAALQNNSAILKQISAVGLSIKGESKKLQLEFVVQTKTTKETFFTDEVTFDDLKKDMSLKNTSAESKSTLGEIKVRQISAKEYLVRIAKSSDEALGLIFADDSSHLQLTHVLGEKNNAEVVKSLTKVAEANAQGDKLVGSIDEALTKLKEVQRLLESAPRSNQKWTSRYPTIIDDQTRIFTQLNEVRTKALEIKAVKDAKSDEIKVIEQIVVGRLQAINSSIVNLKNTLRQEAIIEGQDGTVSNILVQVVGVLETVSFQPKN